MSTMKLIRLSIFAIAVAYPASAQVFVIGGGYGKQCFDSVRFKGVALRDAKTICTQALKEDSLTRSNRAATYVNRGIVHMRDGDYDAAIRDYRDARALSPKLGEAFLNEGAALIYQKNFRLAEPTLTRAIELGSSQLHAAFYNRAIARENKGDLYGAYTDFKEALELRPDFELAEWQLERFSVEEP